MRLLKTIFSNVIKDKYHNYHKADCSLNNIKFTVIKNHTGFKMDNCHIKYCPICGEKLR